MQKQQALIGTKLVSKIITPQLSPDCINCMPSAGIIISCPVKVVTDDT
jgi:hypothetical protein